MPELQALAARRGGVVSAQMKERQHARLQGVAVRLGTDGSKDISQVVTWEAIEVHFRPVALHLEGSCLVPADFCRSVTASVRIASPVHADCTRADSSTGRCSIAVCTCCMCGPDTCSLADALDRARG